ELLSMYVGSDASQDKTDEIIEEFVQKDASIHLTRFERSGKTKIVYTLAREAAREAEIIVFCDADIILGKKTLGEIVSCFADPDVSGVVVNTHYHEELENAGSAGEWRYHGMEVLLRRNESLYHTTVAPTGHCCAARRGSYKPLTDYRLSDDLNLNITISL